MVAILLGPRLPHGRPVQDLGLFQAVLAPTRTATKVVHVPLRAEGVEAAARLLELQIQQHLVLDDLRLQHPPLECCRDVLGPPSVQVHEGNTAVDNMAGPRLPEEGEQSALLLRVHVAGSLVRLQGYRKRVGHWHAVQQPDIVLDNRVKVEVQHSGHVWQIPVQVEPSDGLLPARVQALDDVLEGNRKWLQLMHNNPWDRSDVT
mmetsp:Transcript_11681/g.34125  ORF Transcript_11681/g.34125 Transcript_11681/m.34125 type:complete len:204 (+) Transcript_11681:112-723(+)